LVDSSGIDHSESSDLQNEIYYYVGQQKVRLYPNLQVFAVRLEPNTPQKANFQLNQSAIILSNAEPLTFLPRDRINVYRSNSGLAFLDALRKHIGVIQVYPVYQRTPTNGDIVIVTQRLLVQFKPELGIEKIASMLEAKGLSILAPLPYASPNGFLLEANSYSDGLEALHASNTLVEEGYVVFAEPDLIQSRHWRNVIEPDLKAAEYLNEQWHLQASGVFDAWNNTHGSLDICIAILDDGLDSDHPEFSKLANSDAPKIVAQFDFATGSTDASPKTHSDNHGTACAGIAASNGIKAAGAAPGCRLVVARTPDYLGISDEAMMFQWAADSGSDIISCSWGPMDGLGTIDPLPTPTRLAIRYCLNNGRAGKGIPIFWAAGNGSESVDNDGYAANPDVMAIAACTKDESPASYSDFGSAIFACAPSSGSLNQPAVFTTDRRGPNGYNLGNILSGDALGDYTNSFGGTSAAAPLAAGIAALVLSVNPGLTVNQVRDLLRNSADRIGDLSTYDEHGHSDRLGFGRLNADEAVKTSMNYSINAPKVPTILGPETWSRVDNPPTFQVDPSPHKFYVIEISTRPDLFDSTNHGSERNVYNFYGSWSDYPFQTSSTYTLPAAVWIRLKTAEKLWYRIGSSASKTEYLNYLVSTPDDKVENAPFIFITYGVGAPPSSLETGRRTISELVGQSHKNDQQLIEGPWYWDRRLGPPLFRIMLDYAISYAIEVCVDSKYFDSFAPPVERPAEDYFISQWMKNNATIQSQFYAFVLPLDAWQKLNRVPRLYYRLLLQSEGVVVSPSYIIDLTGESIVATKNGDRHMRIEENLWRRPNVEKPKEVKMGETKPGTWPHNKLDKESISQS